MPLPAGGAGRPRLSTSTGRQPGCVALSDPSGYTFGSAFVGLPLSTGQRVFSSSITLPASYAASVAPGYEIDFNREFFKYQPPRPPAEIDVELEAVERRIMGMLREVTE